MRQPRTSKDFPGQSVIDLEKPFGDFKGSLLRHWFGEYGDDPGVWYEFVLRNGQVTYVVPCPRLTAAQLLVADRARA